MSVTNEQAKAALTAVLAIFKAGNVSDNIPAIVHSMLVLSAYVIGHFAQPSPAADDATNIIFGDAVPDDGVREAAYAAIEYFAPDDVALMSGPVIDAIIAHAVAVILDRLADEFPSLADLFDSLFSQCEASFNESLVVEDEDE